MRRWWIVLLVILAGCGGQAPARRRGQLTVCKSNCKNLATALEMYATDNAGCYPASLSMLTTNYLRAIPECPTAGKETYSSSYKFEVARRDKAGKVVSGRDYFEFCCSGDNHKEAFTGMEGGFSGSTQNLPACNSIKGVIERP